jgi:hypothetical protein
VLGYGASVFASGGAGAAGALARLTPAAMASRFSVAAGGRSLVARGFVEGTLVGAGEGVSQLSLSDDPVNAESVVSTISSNMLYGGAAGAVGGIAGRALERGLGSASSMLERRSARAASDAAADKVDDIAGLDRAGLAAADRAELDRIASGRVADADELVATIRGDFKDQLEDARNLIHLTADEPKGSKLSQAGGNLATARNTLRNALKTPKELARRPSALRKPLAHYEQALTDIIDEAGTIRRRVVAKHGPQADEVAQLHDDVARMRRFLEQYPDDRAGLGALRSAEERLAQAAPENASAFADKSTRMRLLQRVEPLLEQVRGFQDEVHRLTTPLKDAMTPRRQAIAAARDDLLRPPGMMETFSDKVVKGGTTAAVAGALTGVGIPTVAALPVGAWVAEKVGGAVFGRAGKAVGEQAVRLEKVVGQLLGLAKRGAPAVPPTAARTLAAVRYAEQEPDVPKRSSRTQTSYAKRAAEIRSQVGVGGRMTPAARAGVARRLAGVAVGDPRLADQMETLAARKLEFLWSKLPRSPGLALQFGPDRWEPSSLEVAEFARYAAAAEDPLGVVERAVTGNVTPEDIETLQVVYPEMFRAVRDAVMMQMADIREQIPYERRLVMGILLGLPTDPSLDPEILAMLQDVYAARVPEEIEGKPAPKPEMSGISPEPPTASQKRASP